MTEAELKKIHGKDVELAPDDSEDENLSEQKALARAKKEGLIAVDEWVVVKGFSDEISVHKTKQAAEKAAKNGEHVMQRRHMEEIK